MHGRFVLMIEGIAACLSSLHAGHVLAGLAYGATILVLGGKLGGGAGMHDLFRDKAAHARLFNDQPRTKDGDAAARGSWRLWLSPGFMAMALFALWIGVTLELLGLPLRAGQMAAPLVEGWWAFAVLLGLALLALALGRVPPSTDAMASSASMPAFLRRLAGLGAGIGAAVALGWALLPVLRQGLIAGLGLDPSRQALVSALILFALALAALVALRWFRVSAGSAFFVLLITLTTGLAVLAQVPALFLAGAAFLAYMWLKGRLAPFRYRIPGIPARYYQSPLMPGSATDEPEAALVKPEQALKAWQDRRQGGAGPEKPRLVLVALSGGGYRATFWAALVLDRLLGRDRRLGTGHKMAADDAAGRHLDGLTESIRFIAGASGGMVTGGYLAALCAQADGGGRQSLVQMIEADIDAYQRQSPPIAPPGMPAPKAQPVPVKRDSLSALALQLLHDLGHLFRASSITQDRGRVLQAHWATLDQPFSALRDAEARGTRPATIFSPMLVESGAPLFISNLDLGDLRTHFYRGQQSDADEHSAELFRMLPGAHADDGMTLATAARLSASFPYVLPAVSLPRIPHRRVVDAGYYDNYGIDALTRLLNSDKLRDWVITNCSGVLVIALRAFPDDPRTKPAKPGARLFWWLTSPIEAMFNARGSSQTFRNREQLRLTRQLYGAALAARHGAAHWQQAGRNFVDIVTFTCEEEASMSWHLSTADMARLDRAAQDATDPDANPDMQRLLDLWNGQRTQLA